MFIAVLQLDPCSSKALHPHIINDSCLSGCSLSMMSIRAINRYAQRCLWSSYLVLTVYQQSCEFQWCNVLKNPSAQQHNFNDLQYDVWIIFVRRGWAMAGGPDSVLQRQHWPLLSPTRTASAPTRNRNFAMAIKRCVQY